MPTNTANNKTTALQYIRTIYLSIAAVIGLICFIIGASGSMKLVLNVWFPVDDIGYYSMPYDKTPCSVTYLDGKEIPRPAQEVAKCELETEKARKLMATSNFNRELTQSVSLTLVGFPIWLLHFWLIQQDWKKRKLA